jgi:hypothetical protein
MTQENQTQNRYITLIGDEVDQTGQKKKFSFMSDWGARMFLATAFVGASQGVLSEDQFDSKKLATDTFFTIAFLAAQRKMWLEPKESEKVIIDTRPESPSLTHFSLKGITPQIPLHAFTHHLSEAVVCGVTGTLSAAAATYFGGDMTGYSIAATHLQQARLNYKCASGQWKPVFKKKMSSIPASKIS